MCEKVGIIFKKGISSSGQVPDTTHQRQKIWVFHLKKERLRWEHQLTAVMRILREQEQEESDPKRVSCEGQVRPKLCQLRE